VGGREGGKERGKASTRYDVLNSFRTQQDHWRVLEPSHPLKESVSPRNDLTAAELSHWLGAYMGNETFT
jgi:hypothetical protein